MPRSCVVQGSVAHTRTREPSSSVARHSFRYSVWMAFLDLAELEAGAAFPPSSWLVSDLAAHRALASWRRRDYFGDPEVPLSQCVREVLAAQLPQLPAVRSIRLLTNLATLGLYNFNPVSVYYCFAPSAAGGDDGGDGELVAVLLEVSNTPWLDKRIYACALDAGHACKWQKDFHVSPFMDGAHDYAWQVSPPRPGGEVEIRATSTRRPGCAGPGGGSCAWQQDHTRGVHAIMPPVASAGAETGPVTFVVALSLKRVEPAEALLANPIMPLSAVLWIHVHAVAVMWKGVKVGVVIPRGGGLTASEGRSTWIRHRARGRRA
jgi:DUF1365 family protein